MPLMPGHGTVLRSVRLHGAGGDALRARLRLERVLAEVDWATGLPPQALLFVRRLVADARPGLRAAGEGGRFSQEVSTALRQHARSARRPWLHADAAAAEAVCFANEAELVACLLRDWTLGTVAQRWWWHEVLGQMGVQRWLRAEVLPQAPRLVPALALLAERGQAVTCVGRIEEADAVVAWRAVQRAYGLRESALAQDPEAGALPLRGAAAATGMPAGPGPAVNPAGVLPLRQLLAQVPEVRMSPLRPAQRVLLAGALAIVREPAWARTPALAQALQRLAAPGFETSSMSLEEPPMPAEEPRRLWALQSPASSGAATSSSISPPVPMQRQASSPADATAPEPPLAPLNHAFDESRESRPVPIAHAAADEAAANAEEPVRPPPAAVQAADTPPTARPAKTAGSSPREGAVAETPAAKTTVRTRYGGIFYLLNAAIALRVYGDFTMPRAPGLSLSPWDLLAWTGRAWFGADFVGDPVWALLAGLSGHPLEDDPARGFSAPSQWVADADWLTPWGPVDVLWVHASAQRLRVVHNQGFAVLDVPRDRALTPLQQARALCANRADLQAAALRRAQRPLARVPRSDAARWLHHWRCYLDARLERTLGVADVPALVCCHEAVVEAGLADVDVHLALAALPLPIRFAGLDRDPGWIPAAGRSLRFRFT